MPPPHKTLDRPGPEPRGLNPRCEALIGKLEGYQATNHLSHFQINRKVDHESYLPPKKYHINAKIYIARGL